MEVNYKSCEFIILSKYQDVDFTGWYVRDFLGKTGTVEYEDLRSGLNVVPLTISGDYG